MQPDAAWLELEITSEGDEVRASARAGGSGGPPASHRLGPDLGRRALLDFARGVERAAAQDQPLDAPLLAKAEALHHAIFRDGIAAVRSAVQRRGEPLVVRLAIGGEDRELRKVPWEALAAPGQVRGFVGTSPDLLLARAPDNASEEPSTTREVQAALRVLIVAPTSMATVEALRAALTTQIDAGEVELETIEGAASEPDRLLEHIRQRKPNPPNVVHFICHGGVKDGEPKLCLGDESKGEMWLSVALLAQEIEAWWSDNPCLRLVILEACAGANPTDVASAAEILTRSSVDAVVAHLWPVDAEAARVCSVALYGALAGTKQPEGNIAIALNEARRISMSKHASAVAFSPVLYLRAGTGALFNLERRTLVKPAPPQPLPPDVDPTLGTLLRGRFSIIIGDHGGAEGAALDDLEKRLTQTLTKPTSPKPGLPMPIPPGLPLSALAQRVAFHCGKDELGRIVQKTFREMTIPPFVAALARVAGPGAHLTLLRTPRFEEALATAQPERTIYVLQPGDKSMSVFCRPAGDEDWSEAPAARIDPTRDIVVLRLYRGFTPDRVFTLPLLTEDDYLLWLHDLKGFLERHLGDLAVGIFKVLHQTPALLLGFSLHSWDHRELFRAVFYQGTHLADASVAVIEPKSAELPLWRDGTGLPGGSQVSVVEATTEGLTRALEAFAKEGKR